MAITGSVCGRASLFTSSARERDKKIESTADTVGFLATVGVMAKYTSIAALVYLSCGAHLLMRTQSVTDYCTL